jgi:hypothetical protein
MTLTLAENLEENADVIAAEVTQRMVESCPHLFEAYRRKLRNPSRTPEQWCTEDTVHHLQFLSAALTSGPEDFTEYRRWLEGVLTSRGIPLEDIQINFSMIAVVLEERYGAHETAGAREMLGA